MQRLRTRQMMAACGLAGLCGLAWADAPPNALGTNNQYELGVQLLDYQYKEPGVMSTKGGKLGLTAGFSKRLEGWNLSGEARFATGNVNYTSNGTGSMSNQPDRLSEFRLVAGEDYAFEGFGLTPYAGIGYRTLFNDLRGFTTTGARGYRRYSEYLYIPLGVTHRFQTGDDARLSSSLEFDYLAYGNQKSMLSDTMPGLNDPVNKQRKGYGLRLNSTYEAANWSLGVFYHYWNIRDSDTARLSLFGAPTNLIVWEPKNNTNEVGLQLKYRIPSL